MRNISLAGIAAAVGILALAQTAKAESECRSVCDAGTCVQKCVEHHDEDVVVDHDRVVRPDPGPGIGIHVPGVGVEIGR
jgi:hypothetical protein